MSWLLIRDDDQLETDELPLLDLLLQDEKLVELRQLALLFIQIICDGLTEQWTSWLDRCTHSVVTELKNFAITLKKDPAAIFEAICQSWSNGPTEGHINRLKFLKRQMYGRASFDLLRLRVLLVD